MSKTVLITGANRGIGLALVKAYVAKGEQVIGVCRKSSEALEQTGATVIENIDVSLEDGVSKLSESLGNKTIDLLINNAGILRSSSLDNMAFEDMLKQFEVNAMGPLRIVNGLKRQMTSGAKIALISSRMGSVEDNTSGSAYGYRMSKAALNAAGKSLAIDLKSKGIAVALLHPGWVNTEMVNFNGQVEPEDAAAGLIARIERLNLDNSGRFWHANGEELPW